MEGFVEAEMHLFALIISESTETSQCCPLTFTIGRIVRAHFRVDLRQVTEMISRLHLLLGYTGCDLCQQ